MKSRIDIVSGYMHNEKSHKVKESCKRRENWAILGARRSFGVKLPYLAHIHPEQEETAAGSMFLGWLDAFSI